MHCICLQATGGSSLEHEDISSQALAGVHIAVMPNVQMPGAWNLKPHKNVPCHTLHRSA